MNLLTIEQQSPEWYQARIGNVTASGMADAMSFLTRASNGRQAGQSTQKRLDYILEKALERITGKEAWHNVTPPMQDGIDREPWARAAYGVVVAGDAELAKKCGIAMHPRIERFGASPDGLVEAVGLWEGKCPTAATHMEYLRSKIVPVEYVPQCLSQLACLPDREWLDFTSFHPDFPRHLQVFRAPRMFRKEWELKIAEVEDAARKTLAEIAELEAELRAMPGCIPQVPERTAEVLDDTYITEEDQAAWFKSQGMEYKSEENAQ